MPELGTYVKLGCDTEGCEAVDFAEAYVTTEYTGGYCGHDEALVEVDVLPPGWGMQFEKYQGANNLTGKTLYFCNSCCDKIEEETDHRPFRC